MQKVDEYLRHAKSARADAGRTKLVALQAGLEALAKGWEHLAKERLALLEERLRYGGGWNPEPDDAA